VIPYHSFSVQLLILLCFVHLQIAALLTDFFARVHFYFVLKIRMRQAARRDGDFDAIDEMNTLRPLLFN
jgi:hypothetical protein